MNSLSSSTALIFQPLQMKLPSSSVFLLPLLLSLPISSKYLLTKVLRSVSMVLSSDLVVLSEL